MQQAVCPPEDPSPTAFRAAEKRFKRPPPGKRKNLRKRKAKQEHQDNISLCPSDVLDCHDPEGLSKFVHSRVVKAIKGESDQLIHELRSHPGFFVAPKVLTADERYAFLLDVSGPLLEPPATTNLSALHGRLQGLWKASEEDLAVHSQPEQKPQHCSVGSCALAHGKTEARRAQNQKMIDDSSATSCRYEQMQSSHMQLVPQPSTWAASRDADSISARQLLKKVKWATIGPRYDWSDRRYDSSSPCRQLPRFAAAAAQRISGLVSSGQNADEADTDGYGRCHNGTMVCPLSAAAAEPTSRSDCSTEHLNLRQSSNAVVSMQQGSSLVHQARPTGSASIQHQQPGGDTREDTRSVLTQQHRPFQPDAALVCFYRAGDTLCGHQDDAEADLTQPIVSLSLGCSAVLLVGGQDRNSKPVALLLRHGDAVIFSGSARRYYHGVPRVFGDGAAAAMDASALRLPKSLSSFLENTRINISIRASGCQPDEEASLEKYSTDL